MPNLTLVEPAYQATPEYTRTLGDEVADLSDLAHFPPDPEQRLGLNHLFALNARGKSAAFEFAVICSRQNMKTGLLKQAALGWLFLTNQRLVVWSAHEFNTAQEAHRDMSELIDGSAFLSRRVKQIYNSAADRSIELMSGARLVFKARTNTGGKGLSGDKVVLDEGFALRPMHMGSLLPTLSVRPDPQVVYASSAGYSYSDVLRAVRDRGRAGDAGRLAYLEWCAKNLRCELENCDHTPGTPGCSFDLFENVQQANPLLGRTRANGTSLTWEYVKAERAALDPDEYARERLGRWDEPGAAEIFGAGNWEACEAGRPDGAKIGALALAVAVDQASAAIVAAGNTGFRIPVKPLQHGPGSGWALAATIAWYRRYRVPVVVDEGGPAADLIPKLKANGVKVIAATTRNYLDACAGTRRMVVDHRLLHEGYVELTKAANGATERKVGDRWAFGRRTSSSDITPLEGMALAAWYVDKPARNAPPPPPRTLSSTTTVVSADNIARAGF